MDATFHLQDTVFNFRVAGVMIENNHILIHKQVHDEHWALPGGRVEVLEQSKTSIKREVEEELGLAVNVERMLWVTENFFEYNQKQFHEIGFYYLLSSESGSFPISDEEFYGREGERLVYKWVAINDLDSYLLYPEFLKKSLSDLPLYPKHHVIGDYKK